MISALMLALCLPAAQDPVRGAEKDLLKALKDKNAEGVEASCKALLLLNSPASMKALLAAAARGPEKDDAGWIEAYAAMLNAAATFAAPAALAELGEFILRNKEKPVARDAMAAACNHAQKGIDAICVRVLEAGTPDLKIMAADHLIAIAGKAEVPALIAALKANEKDAGDLKRRLGRALTALTGQDYGDSVTNWLGWWEANKDRDWDPKLDGAAATTGTATDGLDRSRMSEFERLKKTGTVLVLEAGEGCKCKKNHDLDHIDQITEKMGLKTERLTKADLDTRNDVNLDRYVAVLANCTHIREHCACPECKPGNYSGNRLFTCVCPINRHDPVRYVLGEKGLARLKKYLEGGGYLFAEDWCMEDFVARAFPEHVTHGSIRPDELVSVLPKPGSSSHPYLRKIFFRPPPAEVRETVTEEDFEKIGHTWKIDKETRTIRVKDPARVTTLLVSPELKKAAQGDEAVAVTFEALPSTKSKGAGPAPQASMDRRRMTGGRVLYVLSHFGKQAASSDEYALQNLLINFLVEASERRAAFEPPK
jgi:hypothetical protein